MTKQVRNPTTIHSPALSRIISLAETSCKIVLCGLPMLGLGCISLLSLLYTDVCNNPPSEILADFSFFDPTKTRFLFIGLVCCTLWLLLFVVALRITIRLTNRQILFASLVVTFVIGMLWILPLQTHYNAFPDSVRLTAPAAKAVLGDWTPFTNFVEMDNRDLPESAHSYMAHNPHQAGLFYYFILVFKIFGPGNITALQFVNVLANLIVVVCLFHAVRFLTDKRPVLVGTMLLVVSFFPFHALTAFPYGNCLGLAFASLAILCNAVALKASRKIRWIASIASVIPSCATVLIKPTYVLFPIAICLTWIWDSFSNKRLSFIIPFIVLYITMSVSSIPASELGNQVGANYNTTGIPSTSRIANGLTMSTHSRMPGWWDADETTIIWKQNGGDPKAQKDDSIAIINDAVRGFTSDPIYALSFFSWKLRTEWSEPTYGTYWYTYLNHTWGDNNEAQPTRALAFTTTLGKVYYAIGDGFQLLVYASALVGAVILFRKKESTALFVLLSSVLFTGIGCYLLWEAKSIYTLPFVVWLLPFSAEGIDAIAELITQHMRQMFSSSNKTSR